MITSGEYIQILEFLAGNNYYFFGNYIEHEDISWIEGAKRLDELRILHLKYKKECQMWLVYPHLDLKNMLLIKKDLIDVCKVFNIGVMFLEKQNSEYKKGIHCFYNYKGQNITDFLVFHQKRAKSNISNIEM